MPAQAPCASGVSRCMRASAARVISLCSQPPKQAIDPATTATPIHSVFLTRIVCFCSAHRLPGRRPRGDRTSPATAGGGLGQVIVIGIGTALL
jgi:hypothetical protein